MPDRVTPCPKCWLGRHTECDGVFFNAAGAVERCSCKTHGHDQPTLRMKEEEPTPQDGIVAHIDAITDALNKIRHLLETTDATPS